MLCKQLYNFYLLNTLLSNGSSDCIDETGHGQTDCERGVSPYFGVAMRRSSSAFLFFVSVPFLSILLGIRPFIVRYVPRVAHVNFFASAATQEYTGKLGNSYTFTQSSIWNVANSDGMWLQMQIECQADALIALSPDDFGGTAYYEINLGGDSNTVSRIRKLPQVPRNHFALFVFVAYFSCHLLWCRHRIWSASPSACVNQAQQFQCGFRFMAAMLP